MAEGELTLESSPSTASRLWRGAGRLAGLVAVGIGIAGMTAWCAAALYYSTRGGSRTTAIVAIAFLLTTGLAFVVLPQRRRTLLGFLVVFAAVVTWWLWLPASNDREWLPEVAVTPWASRDGDLVTIHGVRNFDYRTETDFTPRWDDRTYDLRALDSADLIAVYWAGKAIAHIMLSFGFGGRDYLAVSIETRKAQGQSYSTIATHSHVNRGAPPMSWKILLSGYVPQYAYDLGKLDRTLPFAELERRVWVNERAHAADRDPAFSQRIREVALR